MKTMKQFAYLMAIAIVGVAFTGCKDKNDPKGEGEGSYNGQSVKTQFTISLPQKVGQSANKMKGETVQAGATEADVNFLGMDNIVLVPFAKNGAITASDSRLGGQIRLPGISGNPDNSYATPTHNQQAQVYEDVTIPLGTYSFLFYGHSKNKVLGDTYTQWDAYSQREKFGYGILNPVNLNNASPADYQFNPVQIYTSGAADAKATDIAAYLTLIAKSKEAAAPQKTWEEGGNLTEQGWIDLYTAFVSNRAGSSLSVQAMIEDLYKSVYAQAKAGNTMAQAIKAAILDATYIDNAAACAAETGDAPTLVPTFKAAYQGYPSALVGETNASLGLPDGAASVIWNNTDKKFDVAGTYEWTAANSTGKLDVAKLTKYIYAPSLYYYVNSTILAENSKKSDQYNTASASATNSTTAWEAIKSTLYTSGQTSVTGSTRSVAIKDQIQYAVGRMDLKTKLSAGSLLDSKNFSHTVTGSEKYFILTGVLIGGQKGVGFDFTPDAAGDLTIWDPIMDQENYKPIVATDFTTIPVQNYTLAFETRPSEKIRIAVEFENNSEDFYGVEGKLIPKGTKFYVVAELDPATGNANDNDKGNVFRQDFATRVNLNLTTLSKAYNVVPDLTTPQLELGFSVNLEWQDGYEFNINI
jgi:hypothetical protein